MNIILLNKDLRLENNPALYRISLLKEPVYIFYFLASKHRVSNAIPSINYLKNRLHLLTKQVLINIFETNDEIKLLQAIHKQQDIKNIYINACFTPFGLRREQALKLFCQKNSIKFVVSFDYLCFKPSTIITTQGTISKTFAPFRTTFLNHATNLKLQKPFQLPVLASFDHPTRLHNLDFDPLHNFPLTREDVLGAIKRQINYDLHRDQLANLHFPSRIAAAIGWGVIAISEVMLVAARLFGWTSSFVRQLIFREFYYHYYVFNRSHYIISTSLRSNILAHYDSYPWNEDGTNAQFQAWKEAKTGIQLIDAAMNELLTTHNMKNRMRMVVASFLTKDLNFHWRLGERHFAKLLIDYDPVVNNQSWQWAAGSGLDYRGSSRIFSIARQQVKYDPLGLYISLFLPKKHFVNLNYDPKATRANWQKRRQDWIKSLK